MNAREKAIEFLKKISKNSKNIKYKPCTHSNFIENFSFFDAVEKFMEEYEEMKEFLIDYKIDDEYSAFAITCMAWERHVVC